MFTGLIERTGVIAAVADRAEGRVITIEAPDLARDLARGESVAVDGCCLTVESRRGDGFEVFASPETISRSTLRARRAGNAVNLERSLTLGDRLGGHLVTGHVDAVGTIERLTPLGASWDLAVRFPAEIAPWVVEKGSIAIDGVSLTTFEVTGSTLRVALIPETVERTTLRGRRAGDEVNLEGDLIGKYVERQLALREGGAASPVTEELLQRAGFFAAAAG